MDEIKQLTNQLLESLKTNEIITNYQHLLNEINNDSDCIHLIDEFNNGNLNNNEDLIKAKQKLLSNNKIAAFKKSENELNYLITNINQKIIKKNNHECGGHK